MRSRPGWGEIWLHYVQNLLQDVIRAVTSVCLTEQQSRPLTLGEGRAVDHGGMMTEDSVRPTQPEGGAMHAKLYDPPWSTRHSGALGHSATSSAASYHYEQIQVVASHP